MSEPQESWHRLGEEITRIGERFRDHYRQAGVDESGAGPGEDVRSAFDTLGKSLDRVFTSVGNAFRDPDVQDEARRAANSLVDALGASLEEMGRSLKHLIEAERPDDQEGAWEPHDTERAAVGEAPGEPEEAAAEADEPDAPAEPGDAGDAGDAPDEPSAP